LNYYEKGKMVGMAGDSAIAGIAKAFEPATNGSLQTTTKAEPSTVHSSARLSYIPIPAWSLQYLVKRITAW